jgi:sigma-B regulation protein RsbU (phosphoserine phosphatase)
MNGLRKIRLVRRNVLQPDNAPVHFELGDAIDEKKWIAVWKDFFNRRILERQRQRIHGGCYYDRVADRLTAQDQELVATLFELGREVSAVLDVDELLERIPRLIARLTSFTVFSMYMLDERRQELRIAYAEGYPAELAMNFRLKVGQGIVGAAVAGQRPILVNDVTKDPRYVGLVGGVSSQLAVPLRHKNRVLGALNLLSDKIGAFTERDQQILAQFGVHVAQALANARMFEQERDYAAELETLTEIAREVAAILDLDELLSRIAILTKRVIDYRTFGILLVNESTHQLEAQGGAAVR